MQCLAQVSTKAIAVRGLEVAAWVIATLSTPQFPEHFLLGGTGIIGLVTYCCSVLTSLADSHTHFPPLALHILHHSLLPSWVAGTDTTGCHYQILAGPRGCGTASHCMARLIASTGREQQESLWKTARVQCR